jgi:hypothetical protein
MPNIFKRRYLGAPAEDYPMPSHKVMNLGMRTRPFFLAARLGALHDSASKGENVTIALALD